MYILVRRLGKNRYNPENVGLRDRPIVELNTAIESAYTMSVTPQPYTPSSSLRTRKTLASKARLQIRGRWPFFRVT
jgi:hypothetical protein